MPIRSYAYNSHRLCYYFWVPIAKILFLVLCLTLPGCQSPEDTHSDVRLDWEIAPDPPGVGMATINITLTDSTGQLLTGAEVKLEGNMTHPGMQPVFASAEEVAPGWYSAVIEFTMGGDWFISVKSTLADERVVERQINIPGVQSQ